VECDKYDVGCLLLSVILSYYYVLTKHWILNNTLALAFSVQGIALLSLGSYAVGCILLSGLFFYDVFWVFGTDVMVTVAKSFDGPIKLLFPKNVFSDVAEYSMLGLGDIVIPGIFIALLLRFDHHRGQRNRAKAVSKVYFHVTFIAYILGLMLTVVIMHTFQAAQPALLYLVPACIGSSFLLSVARGESNELLSYSENVEAEDKSKTQ